MASNIHGNHNEKDLISYINNKKYSDLNDNLKLFIKFIADEEGLDIQDDTIILATKVGGIYKPDLQITILNNNYGVSVKTGKGNSIHQEKSNCFVKYIREHLSAAQDICDDFTWFIDSIDDSKTLQKNNPKKLDTIKEFVKENARVLSYRFLKTGLNESNFTDYIYYGDINKGVWSTIEEAINFIEKQPTSNRGALKIGPLGLQAWNRTNEDKRYTLQVKWTSIEKDLKKIRMENDRI